ncbi:MAG: ATP-binding protein [Planctomycetota bacterium]|nr:ATP-binding protein [Planctomycetota bacterium]
MDAATPTADHASRKARSLPISAGFHNPPGYSKPDETPLDYAAILQHSPDLVLVVDSGGCLNYINRELPQHRKQSTVGTTVFELIPDPYQRQQLRQAIDTVIESRAMQSVELRGPDCANQWHACRLIPFGDQHPVSRVLIFATEMTRERLRQEAGFERQEQVAHEKRLSLMGEMSATLAHEINNPLAVISNFAHGSIRRLKAGEWQTDELLKSLTAIAEQSARAGKQLQFIRRFLQKQPGAVSKFAINPLIDEATVLSTPLSRKNNVRFEFRLMQGLPLVEGNSVQIEQVLVNLMVNGIQSMANTPATQRVLRVESSATDAGQFVEVQVIDRGPPIPRHVLDRAFDTFYSTKPNGLGLGLSICKSITEAHGGRLTLKLDTTRGTVAILRLPAVLTENVHAE